MTKRLLVVTAMFLGLGLSAPASADPQLGFGVSVAFGGNQPGVGVGARLLSDDDEDSFAASLGVDYMLGAQDWRVSGGLVRLMDESYIGGDIGLRVNGSGIDYGIGMGLTNTSEN
ncbi:hypothetical protein [Oceanicola sp. S124]|uniref:hypothetical protein n=1 Tax=Oceanicola sp. S124 TaxID=1042378 RepID=UPI0002558909|nr:hypothetical protein [Oceanicola sp. S124]